MKRILSLVAVIALVSISFTSCKKEKAKPVSERIVGAWHLKTILYHEHANGADQSMTLPGGQNDGYEFKADGTVIMTISTESGTSTYSIIDEKQVDIVDDATYDIKNLDERNLILYAKETDGNDFEEMTLTFTK